jgi:hypothetical protein
MTSSSPAGVLPLYSFTYDAERNAVAKFIYDGKTWSVLSISPE